MVKKYILIALVIIIATLACLAVITARNIDKAEIARVQQEIKSLLEKKQVLKGEIVKLDEAYIQLTEMIVAKNTLIELNKQVIIKLEKERDERRWTVRRLNSQDALEKRFAMAFPQVIHANNVGIIKLPMKEGSKILLPYYVIPAWFVETFIIEHNNMLSYLGQIKEYKRKEALYGDVISLNEQVVTLQIEKAGAYQQGYDIALDKYVQLNDKYITLLETPPKVVIKAPSMWTTLSTAALGLTLGLVLMP